jgi:hypothetical protein
MNEYVFVWWHLPLWVAAYGVWWMFWTFMGDLVKRS